MSKWPLSTPPMKRIRGDVSAWPAPASPFSRLATLRARAVLLDLEAGVTGQLRASPMGELFDPTCVLQDAPGAGNNAAAAWAGFGPTWVPRMVEATRRQLEHCDCPCTLLALHSMGGGTGAGLGAACLVAAADEFPELFRISAPVLPATVDDVITAPYNATFSLASLLDSVHAVIPCENDALAAAVHKVNEVCARFNAGHMHRGTLPGTAIGPWPTKRLAAGQRPGPASSSGDGDSATGAAATTATRSSTRRESVRAAAAAVADARRESVPTQSARQRQAARMEALSSGKPAQRRAAADRRVRPRNGPPRPASTTQPAASSRPKPSRVVAEEPPLSAAEEARKNKQAASGRAASSAILAAHGDEPGPRHADAGPAPGRAECAWDDMNSLVAHTLANVLAPTRWSGVPGLDPPSLRDVMELAIPAPQYQLVVPSLAPLLTPPSQAMSATHQLRSAAVETLTAVGRTVLPYDGNTRRPSAKERYYGATVLFRGPSAMDSAAVDAAMGSLVKKVRLPPWQTAGMAAVTSPAPPLWQMDNVTALINSSGVTPCLSRLAARFDRLYRVKAHVHHYTAEVEEYALSEARHRLEELLGVYNAEPG